MARYDYRFDDDRSIVEVEQPIGEEAHSTIDGRPVTRLIQRDLFVNWTGGGGHTRKYFSATTNAEVARDTERRAAAQGREIEPIPQRQELV